MTVSRLLLFFRTKFCFSFHRTKKKITKWSVDAVCSMQAIHKSLFADSVTDCEVYVHRECDKSSSNETTLRFI